VRALRADGVTIILTTHYIDEAEEMADRIGVMHNGEIILVEDKTELMRKLGKKQLTLHLQKRLDAIPDVPLSRLCSVMSERPPPNRSSSDWSCWRHHGCWCQCISCTRCGWSHFCS
jgi:ABC-type multidrug transport system ATPase subunit